MTTLRSPSRRTPRGAMRGLSLVELMVGITIGMIIVAAMSVLFANNSRSRTETERAGVKLDNGRYALEVLGGDLQHAGFLAEFDPREIALPGARPDSCETNVNTLRGALALPVLGHDNVATSTLSCVGNVVPNTDVVVVRRAATCVDGEAECTPLQANALAFQASSCDAVTELGSTDKTNYFRFDTFPSASFDRKKRKCVATADLRRYVLRIYYVAPNDVGTDGIPTLKRRELASTGGWVETSLVQGIQNLQVEWGLDTNGDGNPDVFSPNPDTYCANAGVAAGTCWSLPVTAKLFVLARNIDTSPSTTDSKQYVLGRSANAVGVSTNNNSVGPFNDGYKRNVYQRTVALQNVIGRRFTP